MYESKFSNVKVTMTSIPQYDLMAEDLIRFYPDSSNSESNIISATVRNIGSNISSENTLTYFASDSVSQSNQRILSSETIGEIAAGSFRTSTISVLKMAAQPGDFIWACVDASQFDIDNSNNCSQPKMINHNITPIILWLLDNE